MQSELFILRHSKSDWRDSALSDHDRALNSRGKHDAEQLARWLKANSIRPNKVICSTALRARQTLQPIIEYLDLADGDIQYEERLYLASLKNLLQVIRAAKPNQGSLMIVGHNPGLDELVTYLASSPPSLSKSGKLMTTTSLAHFKMPADWSRLEQQAQLITITRPGDIVD
jgi:phosphohistidine phosphatase